MGIKEDFFEAIKAGDREVVEKLRKQHSGLLNERFNYQITPVLLAMYYNEPGLAQMMIAAGAPLDIFTAAAVNDRHTLQNMIVAQPDLVNAVAPDGFQPLGLAAFFGALDSVQLLIRFGADVNSASRNDMRVAPLHSAVAHQHIEIARLLIENGADVNTFQANDFTPLHAAAQNGQVKMVRLLCEHGANKSAVNAEGFTPLDIARHFGYQEVVGVLQS